MEVLEQAEHEHVFDIIIIKNDELSTGNYRDVGSK
jgi:hypothetical protein